MNPQNKQMIWTRSRKDWDEDQKFLKKLPYKILHLPCIEKESISPDQKTLEDLVKIRKPCFFIFTSQEAVFRAWELARVRALMQKSTCLCFGKTTKKLLHTKKLKTFFFDHCTHAEMMLLPLLRFLPASSTLILPGPKKRAFPLYEKLREKGFQARKLDLYKTRSEAKDEQGKKLDLKIAAKIEESSSIFFASPSAVQGFVKTCMQELKIPCSHLEALCLGKSSGSSAKEFFNEIKELRSPELKSYLSQLP